MDVLAARRTETNSDGDVTVFLPSSRLEPRENAEAALC